MDCIYCKNFNPTLDKVRKNLYLNPEYIPQYIENIKDAIRNRTLEKEKLYIIISDNYRPIVCDGNHRLIAVTLMPEWEDKEILCYLGINMINPRYSKLMENAYHTIKSYLKGIKIILCNFFQVFSSR